MDKLHSQLPRYASLAAVALLLLQAASFAVPLAWPARQGHAATRAMPAAPVLQPLDVGRIVAAHLFGQLEADPSQVAATSLSWTLVGTYADADPEAGMAVVNDGSAQHLYRVGDDMGGGAVLKQVHPRHIVFEHDGRYEELAFPESELPEADAPSVHAVASLVVEGEENLATAQEEPPAAEPEPAPAAGGESQG